MGRSTEGLGAFNFLTSLDLNPISEIQFLSKLSVLYLFSNKIEFIDEIKNLVDLSDLDLRYNQIKLPTIDESKTDIPYFRFDFIKLC